MSNAVAWIAPENPTKNSFHAALAECLTGDAKNRLLSLVRELPTPNTEPTLVATATPLERK